LRGKFAESFGPMPRREIERVGYGIGTRDLKEAPERFARRPRPGKRIRP
jgi:uncharacterized protein (DUF111 family)